MSAKIFLYQIIVSQTVQNKYIFFIKILAGQRFWRIHSLTGCPIYFTPKASIPGYTAALPSSSSMRRSLLYFATRSERLGAPVLI